jgi:hypothetical protein
MVIINPSFATQPAAVNRPAGPAPVLAIDRVLTAVVIGQRANHVYELASGGLKMMAESQTALRQGEQLLLQVIGKDQKQRPRLQILKPEIGFIQNQLRATLPQQQNVSQLLANLAKLSSMPDQQLAAIGKGFVDAIAGRAQSSDPDGLRQAILQSGLFLENQLAKGQAPAGDLKRALLKLSQQISQQLASDPKNSGSDFPPAKTEGKSPPLAREYSPQSRLSPSLNGAHATTPKLSSQSYPQSPVTKPSGTELPGELRPQGRQLPTLRQADSNTDILQQVLRDVRGTIARQESHQLQHLQQSDKSQAQYMIELPVRSNDGIDVWQLHFGKFEQKHKDQQNLQEQTAAEKPQHNWTVTLSFDLPGLGPIKAQVTQTPDINIRFSADNSATTALIESQRHQLEQSLESQGVSTQSIQCNNESITVDSTALYAKSLLDTQA